MSLILPQKYITKYNNRNKKLLLNQGFSIIDDTFMEISVENLGVNSHRLVKVKCDFCDNIVEMPYERYNALHSDKYCCPACLKKRRKYVDEKGTLHFIQTNYKNKDWLYNEYIVKDRSCESIAKECGINLRMLHYWIDKYNLHIKSDKIRVDIPKEILVELYENQLLSSIDIGKKLGTTDKTVMRNLRKYNIRIPSRNELSKRYIEVKNGKEHLRSVFNTYDRRVIQSCKNRKINVEDFDYFTTKEHLLLRGSSVYSDWRTSILKRDHYTCQCCLKKSKHLCAHHIENFADNPDLRLDINNGITLCMNCHSIKCKGSFHDLYGTLHNTRDQLNEYIKLYGNNNLKI